ncbi:MAG: selenocysteine-specific translation elongation factor [Solidesulfovibrio sp.]|uniref:selenocysteine-specific translation elongation factor n=1 Tax=Solidesulfovibrio sp. TaxID=2910990 RepID=UPI0031585B80
MPVIMGTAGHIDHGKTTLIKALTGIDCDRLAEEKKRGITIELGFAFMDLPGGARLGVIDVPGHERFVKNMVAGAAGIDFVMLVVAADEGVMPQTREHLDICTLLGVQTGLVALTKADMVDEDWLAMVTDDVRAELAGTFLADAPLFPVSSHTGAGLPELRDALAALVADFAPRRRSDLARLPIDRVFTLKGHGTVVTGTLIAGTFRLGEDVQLFPTDKRSKIRGLQSHGETVEESPAGRRTAVNLPGLEVEDIARGEVLARPGTLFPDTVWEVELACLASAPRAIKHRTEVHFHHGTRELLARVHLLDRDKLEPGQTAVCQMRFPEPLAGVYGDRLVVRSGAPLRTMAGGRVLSPMGRKVKRFDPAAAPMLAALATATGPELVALHLDRAGVEGLGFARLMTLTDLESKALDKALAGLSDKGRAALVERDGKEGRHFVAGAVLTQLAATLADFVAAYHAREPLKLGISRSELASTWGKALSPKLFHYVVERQLRAGVLSTEQDVLRLADHKVSLASDQATLRATLLDAYRKGGLTPPNVKDILEPLSLTFKEAQPVYKVLMDEGRIVKAQEGMYFCAEAIAALIGKVRAYYAGGATDMGPAEFRELTGLSRKFLIALLEYLDKEKITIRVGDKRQLRGK